MKVFDMKKVGLRIKQLRKAGGLSQLDLAHKIGVAQNTLAQYENGTSRVSVEVLFKLALELEESADFFLCLKD